MNDQSADKFADLRKRAEQILTEQSALLDQAPAEELAHVLYDLQVHQIELELQNQELRRAQLELETSHRNYLELYDFAPVGYFTLDQAGLIVEANLTSATLLDMERGQLIQQPFWKFVSADDQEAYYFFRKQIFESSSTQFCELKLNIQSDSPVYVKLDGVTKLNGDGDITHTHARMAMSDISIQKQAEKQAFDLAIEKEKIEILRTFLENAAHNLRTPLTVLIASLYMLEHQPLLDHQKPRITVIKGQVDRLAKLLENMLFLLHMDEDAGFEFGYLNLNVLVGNVIDELETLAEQQEVTCIFYRDTNLPRVWADRTYLASALSNLITNACLYTPSGGEVLVYTVTRDGNAEIAVKDNGIGISDTDLPHIFERFFRANLAINTHQQGTGLGLSIVEKIIKAHHGSIAVESELGRGSIFRISLPVVSNGTALTTDG
jgi:signal transduction histidine kinase